MLARDQARSKASSEDHAKTCAKALNEQPNARSPWIDVHPSEKLVARLNVPPNSAKPFKYSNSGELVVMFRPNATDRMRCKYGNDYPVAICRGPKTCISSWYTGLKLPSVNGRIQGIIKNSGSEAIDVIVIVCFCAQSIRPRLRPIVIDIQRLHDQKMKSDNHRPSNRKPRRVLRISCNPRHRGNADAIGHKMPFEPPPIA